jgi:hypothetical protein
VSRRIVRGAVRKGLQATFSPEAETHIEAFPDGKVRVSGWVDLASAEGKPERQTYSVMVVRNAARKWVSESITITPQM